MVVLALVSEVSMRCLNKPDMIEFVRERTHLFEHAGQVNPFSSPEWMLHFIEQIAEADWNFILPEQKGDGESLMLLYDKAGSAGHASAVTNYYASLYSAVLSSENNPLERCESIKGLVGQLVKLGARTSVVDVSPLDAQSDDTKSLRRHLSECGWYVRQYSCFGNWYLPCEGLSFYEYMKTRDSKLLNTWTRKRKKFDTGSDGARLEITTEPDKTRVAMDAFERVYAKSWKKPEPYPDFVRNWAIICAEKGWLRLGLAWVGDVPIAAQFWFTMNGRAHIFKLAYDEGYSKWSAGTVLSAHLFRHALDVDRVREIDYLTGDDDYKKTWVTERRERIGFVACNPLTMHGFRHAAKEFLGYSSHRLRRRGNSFRFGLLSALRGMLPLKPSVRERH